MSKKTKLKETASAGPTIVAKCPICKFPLLEVRTGVVDHFRGDTQEEQRISLDIIAVHHFYYERTRFDHLARSKN